MRLTPWLRRVALAGCLAFATALLAQPRPYIGFVYPAGGQQGTTVRLRLGGQNLDGVHAALVTGSGVTARGIELHRRLNNQEVQLLREQLRQLRQNPTRPTRSASSSLTSENAMMNSPDDAEHTAREPAKEETTSDLIARIEKRTREFVQNPACAAIATVTTLDVVIAPDAQPGDREIRLVTARGVSNPLTFHVGQLPESTRKPMPTTPRQVLGKEAQALRKRPASEIEERITLPCTVNGQIGSGEVNWYRFEARQGQQLVITTLARQLIPFIADAVPGWFQPVLTLYDATGKEVAYADDYRFDPDPTLVYEVPRRSEYRLAIRDSIYWGREDFVYRITIGDVPFVTSIFPLGGRAGEPLPIRMQGWNLDEALLSPPPRDAAPGLYWLTATRRGLCSNRVPFALDALPEALEQPPNDRPEAAQTVALPLIINGRIEKPDAWDVFAFTGHANQSIVAEVQARRLGSPLDSVLKLTDPTGTVLALNDDYEDVASGPTTHQADSCFIATLPADGTYHVHLGDTARQGGEAYGYRLRLSEPEPDFALRVAPSSIGLRGRSTATVSVYAQRKDGFDGPIRLALQNPPPGFSAPPVTLAATQTVARLTMRSDRGPTGEPVDLRIVGSARIGGQEITHQAVPAEDMMQAFLWRHLVPARDLKALVFNPATQPMPGRLDRTRPQPPATSSPAGPATPSLGTNAPATASQTAGTNVPGAATAATPPKFTRQQIAGRLRQLRLLYEEGLLTDEFYEAKVAECEAGH